MVRRLGPMLACVAFGLFAACLGTDDYVCEQDTQCKQRQRVGLCTMSSWCAYPDPDCETGYRYSSHAGDGLADRCVPPGEDAVGLDSGSATEGLEGSAGASDDAPDVCSDGCSTPPSPCFLPEGACDAATDLCVYEPQPEGASCDDDDPCTSESSCDGAGTCEAAIEVVCDTPPSPCHEPVGTCDATQNGACVYVLQPSGAPCEDGDACSVGDVCDEAGQCVAGATCPSDDPCQVGACAEGRCTFSAVADGASCGGDPAARCCGGLCVDISTDPAHCGGCGYACGGTKSCQSVDVTTECNPAPADTSGRCTCDANTDCPGGQICRTQSPGAFLCAPEGPRDCPAQFVDVQLCPNYCTY